MDSFLLVGERPLGGSLRNQQVTEGFTPFYNLDRHKRNYKMAIAKGRNNMLASIEDSASMLNSLVNELDRFYSNRLNDFERKFDLLRIENKNEEPEVLCSMCSDWNYAISIYDELFTETKEMLICKVYSYTEKHMSELLSMLGYSHNKISKEYQNHHPSTQGISDIDKCCYILQNNFGLEQNLLDVYWPIFYDFHKLRKDIEHRYNHSYVTIVMLQLTSI